ncbi:MAG: ABC transporter permease [Vicinamibacterales bacterium]|jgi:ABC-2 type transport system permease protein
MIRWTKVRTVAAFEFFATVKRTGYLVATFGMPLFMAAYAGIVAIPAYYAEKGDRMPNIYGVIDRAGVLRMDSEVNTASHLPDDMRQALEAAGHGQALDHALAFANFVFRPYTDEQQARDALIARQLKGFYIVPEDYLATGRITMYSPETFSFSSGDSRDALAELLRGRLVAGHVDAPLAARIVDPIDRTARYALTRTGEVRDGGAAAAVLRLAVPLVFMVLFLLSVLMTSGYLMQGTATEKENKVVEVLLASANPDEILAGKLLGLGAAGLLQIGVWLAMVLTTGLGIVPLLLTSGVALPWTTVALAIPFFVLAFLFFGGLMLGTGSLGSNMREAQQLAMIWSLTAALPMMLMAVLMKEPHGTVARVLTWLPFTAGPVVVLRASTDGDLLAWWEVAVALLILAASTWLALHLGARLFRVGLLNSGARPSFREIVRQARLGA